MASQPPPRGSTASHGLLGGGLRAFSYSQFRVLWGASLLSIMSFFMLIIARGWLILDMTDSPFMVTAVQAVSMAPMMVLPPFGGVIADRMDRRVVLIVSDAANLAILLALAILLLLEMAQVWHVFVLAVLNGVSFSLTMPARAAAVPELVAPEDIANGTSIYSTIFSTSQLIGPAFAGYLMKIDPEQFGWAFLAASLMLVPAMGLLTRLRLPRSAGGGRESVLGSIAEGVSYIRMRSLLVGLLLLGMVFSIFGMPYQALLPVFARDVLGAGPDGLGLLGAFGGAGAIVGSLVVAYMSDPRQLKTLMIWGGIGFGGLVVVFGLSSVFALSLILSLGLGFLMQVFITANFALLQVTSPAHVRGRVLGIRFLVMGLGPVGIFVLGYVAEAFSPQTALASMGVLGVVLTAGVVLSFPALRRAESEVAEMSATPPDGSVGAPATEAAG
jgi:MFS family permease